MAIPPRLRALKPGMAEKLGYYVYLYVDPRDGKVFYIGKGKGERCPVFRRQKACFGIRVFSNRTTPL